jgi:GTP cyclohydrolase I
MSKAGDSVPTIAESVLHVIRAIGEDPERQGLRRTPARVEESFRWLTRGYTMDPSHVINGAIFESDCDEMVTVRDIEVYSLCEHHLLPFFGRCHIAYLPKGKIIGLSKLARLTDAFARRLQVQETLTMQIARTLQEHLQPKGVGVVIQAYHLCMMMRGVEKQNTLCITSAMLGRFKSDSRTRQEFLDLVRMNPGR